MYPINEQLETKWWHRLIKVSILIISIGVFGAFFFTGIYYTITDPKTDYVFSFEHNYEQVKGNETDLKTAGRWISSDVMYDIEKTVKGGNYYNKLGITQNDIENTKKEGISGFKIFDNKKFSELIENIPILVTVKVVKDYNYEWLPVMLIISLIIASVIYLGLWLIYKKIILYIVFGKRQSNERKD